MEKLDYLPENVSVIAETDTMRFIELALGVGKTIPWHIHSDVTEWCINREGQLRIETSPGASFDLEPGGMCQIPSGTVHRVVNSGTGVSRFVLVHGVGAYDFVALGDDP